MKYYFKCPKCGNNESFTTLSEDENGLGCLILFFGGILPALFYTDARNRRIQCVTCGHIFHQPTLPESPVSKLSKWIILVLILFVFFGFLTIAKPEFASIIPKYQWLRGLEEIISKNPYIIAFALTAFVSFLVVTTTLSMLISNTKFKSEFRTRYRTEPEDFSQVEKKHQPNIPVSDDNT